MRSDRAVALDLIKRAEASGYTALAITVDTPVLGRREADVKNKFSLPNHLTMGNFAHLGGFDAAGAQSSGATGSGLASYVAKLIDQTLSWDDIKWVKSVSKLKIVVKGIMTPEDAKIAVKHGVDGIWVSMFASLNFLNIPESFVTIVNVHFAIFLYESVYIYNFFFNLFFISR